MTTKISTPDYEASVDLSTIEAGDQIEFKTRTNRTNGVPLKANRTMTVDEVTVEDDETTEMVEVDPTWLPDEGMFGCDDDVAAAIVPRTVTKTKVEVVAIEDDYRYTLTQSDGDTVRVSSCKQEDWIAQNENGHFNAVARSNVSHGYVTSWEHKPATTDGGRDVNLDPDADVDASLPNDDPDADMKEIRDAFKTGAPFQTIPESKRVNDATETARVIRHERHDGLFVDAVAVYFVGDIDPRDTDAVDADTQAAFDAIVDHYDLVPAEYEDGRVVFIHKSDGAMTDGGRDTVETTIGTMVVETPRRVYNPVTEDYRDLTNLSEDGYCRRFLAIKSAATGGNTVELDSSPVATFDKDKWELSETDGHFVMKKREPETEFDRKVMTDGGTVPTCVVCGFKPTDPTDGLTTIDADDVDVKYPNDVPDVNAAPDGTEWACHECRDFEAAFAEVQEDLRNVVGMLRDEHYGVYEDDDVIVFEDEHGYEIDEAASTVVDRTGNPEDASKTRQRMHELADEHVNRPWPAVYPIVVIKDNGDDA